MKSERTKVDIELRKLGFGGLNDPNLIPQIAFFIRNHEQFRTQLFSVMPDKRRLAYESLRPHLRFEAKPLDVYEAEMKQEAERQQLSGYDEKTGQLIPFRPATDLASIAEEAIKKGAAHGALTLVCKRCTREQLYFAHNRLAAWKDAALDGWREIDGEVKALCPACNSQYPIQ